MNKTIIQSLFKDVLENPVYREELINQYFSSDYIQYVDGKVIDFEHFIKHIKVLKDTIKKLQVDILTIVEENDIVFTNHIATMITNDGCLQKNKVIAEFGIKDSKIYYCDELTFLLEGEERYKDLGSRV